MAISINSNTAAFEAVRNLQLTSDDFVQAVQRLSSGLRINSAADDPAGQALGQKFLSQSNGFNQVQRNMQDSVSLLQTAEAGLDETQTVLQRMNELAVQASNGTLTSTDRQNIQLEILGLIDEIDRVAQQTQYNTKKLLNGAGGAAQVQGGGADINNIQAQAAVSPVGTYTITAATKGGVSTITGNTVAGAGATFTGVETMTITGPTGASASFTTFVGESVSNFIQQVNSANIGVTIDTSTGSYRIVSQNVGGQAGNPTGPLQITTSGPAALNDFGTTGANLQLAGKTGVDPGTGLAAAPGSITLTPPVGGAITVTLQGINSDQFTGTGGAAGVTFRVINPATIAAAPTDSFRVTQNPAINFQVGANAFQTVSLAIDAQTSTAIGVSTVDLSTQTSAEAAITTIQNAINQVSTVQANLGAMQTRLTDVQNNASAQELNMLQARSNVMDANIPEETIRFTRDQILLQAGTAILAQANQTPGGLLGLFSTLRPTS